MKKTLRETKKTEWRGQTGRNAASRVGEIITYGQNFPAVFDTHTPRSNANVAQLEELFNEKNFHSARHRIDNVF